MNRDFTESQRFWTPPDIGTREPGEVVRGRKKGPERGQKEKRNGRAFCKTQAILLRIQPPCMMTGF